MKFFNKLILTSQKLIATFTLVLIFSGMGWSQVSSNFSFSQSVGTYIPITGATVLSTATNQDLATYNVTGLSFPFLGSTISQVVVGTDGYIALGVATFTNNIIPLTSGNAASGIIAALGMNLVSSTVSGASPNLSWVNNGSETVFQWQDFARSTFASSERVNFQLRINNTNGAINLVYGAFIVGTSTASPQIGLRGSTNSDYFARRLTTSEPDSSPSWDDTTIATNNAHSVRLSTFSPVTIPEDGRRYTFTPMYCIPAASSTLTYINNFSTTGGTTNISNLVSGFTAGGYQNNYATQNATIAQGGTLTATFTVTGGTAGVAIWVDLNNNQTFETSERLYNSASYLVDGNYSVPIAIPVITATGQYTMRILTDYNASSPSPCLFGSGRGEAEDYKVTVIAQPTDAMDYANLQFPATASINAGGAATIYTQGYEPGVTPGPGAGAGITVWIGVNATNTDPATWSGGAWSTTTFNVQVGNNDEFQGNIGSSLIPGTYYYASRWQLNGGPYVYGGYNVGGGGFWNGTSNVSGVLTVNPIVNDDPCGAIILTPTVSCTYNTYTNLNATATSTTTGGPIPVPGCGGYSGGDVWFQITVPPSGILIIDSQTGVILDSGMAMYSSSDNTCNGLFTLIECDDDDSPNGAMSYINRVGLTPGSVVFVRFYEFGNDNNGTFGICVTTVACGAPTASVATLINSSTANANWTPTTGSFIIEYGPTSTFGTPGAGASAGNVNNIVVTASNVGTKQLTALTATTGYSYVVRQDCTGSANGYSLNSSAITFTTLAAPPANNEATSATAVGLGVGCTGAIYTNVNATPTSASPSEPKNGGGDAFKTVWFTFVAPSSGAVRVSTDVGSGNSLTDSRVAIYSATNPSDYNTFTCISTDEDGGYLLSSGFMSVVYATGLISGNTYYVQVGTYGSSTTTGTFCMTVDEMNSLMLALTATCASTPQSIFGTNPTYTGWVPILDASSKLIALVKNPTGASPGTYTNLDQNINSGAVRTDGAGKRYLDRNYSFSNPTAGPYDLQLFFLTSERDALAFVDPSAATLTNLNVTRDPGVACKTFPTGVDNTLLTQQSSGSINGVDWVQVSTPGFSGFFINTGLTPLPVNILSFDAKSLNNKTVQLTWNVASEVDVKEYVVERSNDNRNWSAIGSVKASQKSTYGFNDNSPVSGVNYYRLAVKDVNASVAYSDIRTVNFSGKGNMALYPNPANNTLYVSGTDDKNVVVSIYNEVGHIVTTLSSNGETIRTGGIDVSQLLPGAYSIQVKGESGLTTMRFVKQ